MDRRRTLQLLASAACTAALPCFVQAAEESLKSLAAAKGMRFGNALGTGQKDPVFLALMAKECNLIVAENATKWRQLEEHPGQIDFSAADRMFGWARSQGMSVRGHTLLWQVPRFLPDWVNQYDFGAEPRASAERLLGNHIAAVCGHFGDMVSSWDVVNEAIDPETGAPRANVFTERLGAVEQIDLCFRLAREHAPHAQLVYNDFAGWEGWSAKHRDGVLKLLHALKSRGTPIDALGLQSHIRVPDGSRSTKPHMREWRAFLDEVTGMGLDLVITEFDVNDARLPGSIAERDAGVAAIAREYLDFTLSYPQVRDMLLWGMLDNWSWLQKWEKTPRADGQPLRPCPYDAQMKPKALREAIAASLRHMPKRA